MKDENIDTLQKNIVKATNTLTKGIYTELEQAETEGRPVSIATIKGHESGFMNSIFEEISNAKGRDRLKKGFWGK